MTFHCAVVLPAAGHGQRFGSTLPKQLQSVHGQPLLLHTLQAFVRIGQSSSVVNIRRVVIACPAAYLNFIREFIRNWQTNEQLVEGQTCPHLDLVEGEHTRHRTIRKCIQQLSSERAGDSSGDPHLMVIIHDAVRPLICADLVEQLLEKSKKYGVRVCVCVCVDAGSVCHNLVVINFFN